MSNAKTSSKAVLVQRQQLAEAVLQGYVDSVLASDLSTARTNGYIPGMLADNDITNTPISGVNRP